MTRKRHAPWTAIAFVVTSCISCLIAAVAYRYQQNLGWSELAVLGEMLVREEGRRKDSGDDALPVRAATDAPATQAVSQTSAMPAAFAGGDVAKDRPHPSAGRSDHEVTKVKDAEVGSAKPEARGEAAPRGQNHQAGKGHAGPKIMYAVFTSKKPEYHRKLVAMMETWAQSAINEGRFFAIGGRAYPTEWLQRDSVVSVNCDDGPEGLSCKEAMLMVEGIKRGADWLYITGEDNYINTEKIDAKLRGLNPSSVVAMGCVGCGAGRDFCPQVRMRGGFCGGCGYAISRGALAKLMDNGPEGLIKEYGGHEKQKMPNDMATSCALLQRGVQLQHLGIPMSAGPTFGMKDYQRGLKNNAVFHYVQPDVMRWVHGLKTGIPEEQLALLEATAFDRGCGRGMNTPHWKNDYKQCLERHKGMHS